MCTIYTLNSELSLMSKIASSQYGEEMQGGKIRATSLPGTSYRPPDRGASQGKSLHFQFLNINWIITKCEMGITCPTCNQNLYIVTNKIRPIELKPSYYNMTDTFHTWTAIRKKGHSKKWTVLQLWSLRCGRDPLHTTWGLMVWLTSQLLSLCSYSYRVQACRD